MAGNLFMKNDIHNLFSHQPDFVKLAESYGIKGYQVKTQEEADAVLKEVLTSDEPVLLDCRVNPQGKCLPNGCSREGIT